MNGKIKTKFAALFAVALMITVCVVPMVGNDYGEAETITVLDKEVEDVIISGNVYDADGNGLAGAKIIITGGIEGVEVYTSKTGAYSATVSYVPDLTNGVSFTVTLDTSSWTKGINPAEGLFANSTTEASFDVFTAEKVSGLNFKAGNILISGSAEFANGVLCDENFAIGLLLQTATTDEDVTTYEYDPVESVEYTEVVDGAYILSVPANLSSNLEENEKYVVGMGDATINSNVFEDAEYIEIVTIGSENITVDFKITDAVAVNIKVSVDGLNVPSDATLDIEAEGVTFDSTFESIDLDADVDEMIVFTKIEDATEFTLILVSEGYGDSKEVTLNFSKTTEIEYKLDKYIEGTISFKNGPKSVVIPYEGINVQLYSANAQQEVTLIEDGYESAVTDSDGKFKIWYGDVVTSDNDGDIRVGIVWEGEKIVSSLKEVKNSNAYTSSVTITDSDYALVSGKVTGFASGAGIEGIEVSITDDINAITDAKGIFNAYVELGTEVEVSADSEYGYDVDKYSIVVIGDNDNFNFVMDEVEITISVEEESAPIEGASVFYSSDYVDEETAATWSKALITDENGEVKFKVDQIVTENLWAYATLEGRTFGPAQDIMDDAVISPVDSKYVVNFVSPAGGEGPEIIDVTGLTLPAVMKGTSVALGDEAGTKYTWEVFGSLTLDEDGSAYIYVVPGDYTFFLYDEDGMIGDFYLEKDIFEFENGVITLTLFKWADGGFVVDANDNELAGMNIVFSKNDVVIGSGVTNAVGYCMIVFTEDYADATVQVTDPAGIYTFPEGTISDNSTVDPFKAEQGTYAGEIKNGNGTKIINSDAKVSVIDADGNVTYTADVKADGSFEVIGILGQKVSVSASGYTFVDGVIAESMIFTSKEYVATVVLSPAVEGISVEIYKAVENDLPVLIDTIVTGENGTATIVLSSDNDYAAKAISVEYGIQFANEYVPFNDEKVAEITYPYPFVDLTIKSNNGIILGQGYSVESFDCVEGTETIYNKVGQAVSDENGIVSIVSGEVYKVLSPSGSAFTFGAAEYGYYITDDANVLKANESAYSGNVAAASGEKLAGVTVTLVDEDEVSVGTAVTDAEGNYEIVAIGAITAYAADISLEIGNFTFNAEGVEIVSGVANIVANESIYSGYYAEGAVIDGVVISYVDDGVAKIAKIIGNEYYIVISGDTFTIEAKAPNFYSSGTAGQNLTIDEDMIETYDVDYVYSDLYSILGYNGGEVAYGTVLTLVAQNEYNESVEITITNVVETYKFAGWYVNGVKISDSNIATYTVTGDCTIYADYKVSTSTIVDEDNSNGLSMDVLVLGIVIVVLALLALLYAVKFKKE